MPVPHLIKEKQPVEHRGDQTDTLQPPIPSKIREFLQRVLSLHLSRDATTEADARFWQIAGGDDIKSAWLAWEQAGGGFDAFLTDAEDPKAFAEAWEHSWYRERLLSAQRNLIHLASNPICCRSWRSCRSCPPTGRNSSAASCRCSINGRKMLGNAARDTATVPDLAHWLEVLGELAEAMQFASGARCDAGAQTVLRLAAWPTTLTPPLLDFSRDASVLQLTGDDLRFTHQLLQEYLASRVLLVASQADPASASRYWPKESWWEGGGWEVVAEIAAESLAAVAIEPFIAWLARVNPALAVEVWQAQDRPTLTETTRRAIHVQWFNLMTDIHQLPQPRARAAIGTALGRFSLDARHGIGLDDAGTAGHRLGGDPGRSLPLWREGRAAANRTRAFLHQPLPHHQRPVPDLYRYCRLPRRALVAGPAKAGTTAIRLGPVQPAQDRRGLVRGGGLHPLVVCSTEAVNPAAHRTGVGEGGAGHRWLGISLG